MGKRLIHPSPKDTRDGLKNIRDSPETIRGNSRDIRDGHKDTSDGLKNIHDSPEDIRDGLKNIRDSPRKSGWKPSRPPSRSQRCSNRHQQKNHPFYHSLHYYIYKGSHFIVPDHPLYCALQPTLLCIAAHFIVHCSPLCCTRLLILLHPLPALSASLSTSSHLLPASLIR